jgi:hypothetical protein
MPKELEHEQAVYTVLQAHVVCVHDTMLSSLPWSVQRGRGCSKGLRSGGAQVLGS